MEKNKTIGQNKINQYKKMKKKHQKEINEFPLFFAFDKKQLDLELQKLNLTTKDIVSIGNGGFMPKTERKNWKELSNRQYEELKNALKNDYFLHSAFLYELANHEYCYTYDFDETLSVLGLVYDNLTGKEIKILNQARKEYLDVTEC